MKQLAAQMRSKITNVLRWRDGDWMLTPGPPPPSPLHTPVEAPRVVFARLAKTAPVAGLEPEVSGGGAEQNLYDQLFGEETAPERAGMAPSLADDDEEDQSGVMQVPHAAAKPAAAAKPVSDVVVEALRKEVLREYLAVQG